MTQRSIAVAEFAFSKHREHASSGKLAILAGDGKKSCTVPTQAFRW
jgi:hypothetical protein